VDRTRAASLSAAPRPGAPARPASASGGPAPSRARRSRIGLTGAVTSCAAAILVAAAVTERAAVAASFAVLGHLHWLWIPAAIVLEGASMAAFAIMLRRLLAAGGAAVGVRSMLATAYAANALSVSVPLAGPELATAFTFRRFTRQGADAPLAGWSLLAGGVVSSAAAGLIAVGGGLASGNVVASAVAVSGGVLGIAALVAARAAARRPQLRGVLEGPAAWALRHGSRMLRRPAADPRGIVSAWAERMGALQLAPAGWLAVTGLGLVNWLADAAVLAVSIHAAGAAIPWHDLLLVYGAGVAAQSLNLTPGGVGVAEGALSLALVGTGVRAGQALAAVLLYRLASFWLVALAGWLVFLWIRHSQHRRRDAGPGRAAAGRHAAVPATPDGSPAPAMPGGHELVLLHGQPGAGADWDQVASKLPARFHAVALDRPGYGSSQLPAGGFTANARAVISDLDARGVRRAVLVGHSYGGGVALAAASSAPERVEAVVLLASVGPGCANGWDRLLAAPGTGPLCALVAWRLTPWIARVRLALLRRRLGRPPEPHEYVNWQVWAGAGRGTSPLWRTFLAEQRTLLRDLHELERAIPSVQAPVLLLADPHDTIVPVSTARLLVQSLPDACLQLVHGAGHHLPRRAPDTVAEAIVAFLAAEKAPQPAAGQPARR
jgi:pimeloyl-ACP methyl ester carboxylesterase/uncharacterized membrane protein YbhN (UPF0104 family)